MSPGRETAGPRACTFSERRHPVKRGRGFSKLLCVVRWRTVAGGVDCKSACQNGMRNVRIGPL